MGHHGVILVLLLACAAHCVNGQPYTVNNMTLNNCPTKMTIRPYAAQINRGARGAPCTGLLYYTGAGAVAHPLCGERESFNEASAQRLCHTLGINTDRLTGSSPGVRLYRCDAYVEDGAPVVNNAGDYVNEVDLSTLNDKRCNRGVDFTSHDCFDNCYFGDPVNSLAIMNTMEDSCADSKEPFWGVACTDINECLEGTLVDCTGPFDGSCKKRKPCGGNTSCTNMPGSYKCDCKIGYMPAGGDKNAPYSLDTGCVDIDECFPADNLRCGATGQCQNTPGSYICTCPLGQFWSDSHRACTGSMCPPPRPDANASISYIGNPIEEATYTCRTGFTAPGSTNTYMNACINDVWENNGVCTDVDECRPSQCDPNAMCTNNVGSFQCVCNMGYDGSGLRCIEIDPCDTFRCVNGDCVVEDGLPECSCDSDYEGSACDREINNMDLIIAIAALVVSGIILLVVLLYICARLLARPPSPPVVVQPPQEEFYGRLPAPLPVRKPFGFPPRPPLGGRGPWPIY